MDKEINGKGGRDNFYISCLWILSFNFNFTWYFGKRQLESYINKISFVFSCGTPPEEKSKTVKQALSNNPIFSTRKLSLFFREIKQMMGLVRRFTSFRFLGMGKPKFRIFPEYNETENFGKTIEIEF